MQYLDEMSHIIQIIPVILFSELSCMLLSRLLIPASFSTPLSKALKCGRCLCIIIQNTGTLILHCMFRRLKWNWSCFQLIEAAAGGQLQNWWNPVGASLETTIPKRKKTLKGGTGVIYPGCKWKNVFYFLQGDQGCNKLLPTRM